MLILNQKRKTLIQKLNHLKELAQNYTMLNIKSNINNCHKPIQKFHHKNILKSSITIKFNHRIFFKILSKNKITNKKNHHLSIKINKNHHRFRLTKNSILIH